MQEERKYQEGWKIENDLGDTLTNDQLPALRVDSPFKTVYVLGVCIKEEDCDES